MNLDWTRRNRFSTAKLGKYTLEVTRTDSLRWPWRWDAIDEPGTPAVEAGFAPSLAEAETQATAAALELLDGDARPTFFPGEDGLYSAAAADEYERLTGVAMHPAMVRTEALPRPRSSASVWREARAVWRTVERLVAEAGTADDPSVLRSRALDLREHLQTVIDLTNELRLRAADSKEQA